MLSLDNMLNARSVAVIGASERSGSVGATTLRELTQGGFLGEVFPVNPRYETIGGLTAYRSIEEVGKPVDLAVLVVPNAALENEMKKVAEVGARSVAIFASCHGSATDGNPLRAKLATLANDAGIPICGGNGMGFLNVERSLRVCGFYQPRDLRPGGVTFISHSGSLFSAMLHNQRDIRFNLVVSSGMELNTTMDAYMRWALDLESTRVLALFLETVRNPDGFKTALGMADDRDIPVVALKVGSSERGRHAVATHSEAVAGEDAVYEALFEAYGVHRVDSMDEMADTVELFAAGRTATAPGLGAVLDSGGERALLIDTADRVGVSLPAVAPTTEARIAAALDPGLEPANPVDAWGTGRGATDLFVEILDALADDEAIGAVALCVDLTSEVNPDEEYSRVAIEAVSRITKPLMVITNLSTTVDAKQAKMARAAGVPVLEGTMTSLRAVGHLLRAHAREKRSLERRLTQQVAPIHDGDEVTALDFLHQYGIATPRFEVAETESDAIAAGSRIGYPVVLKTRTAAHKTDVAGVVLGIADGEALVAAYREMSGRLGPRVLVAEDIGKGIELALGMVNDPQFGPVVLVSAGGTLIELLEDRIALLPPVDTPRALAAIRRLRVSRLLVGHRGLAPAELAPVADAIVRFSELAVDSASTLSAIDVNPLIVTSTRAVAVDALFEARS